MRRLLPILLLLLGLGACEGAPPPASLVPQSRARAVFPPGGVVDRIEVDAVDRLPLRAAELIAPDGALTPSEPIVAIENPGFSSGQFAANNPVQSDILNNTGPAVLTPADAQAGAALQSQGRLLAIASRTSIVLPDRAAYRRDWQHYRIRLAFGVGSQSIETRDLAAPPPPPGL